LYHQITQVLKVDN